MDRICVIMLTLLLAVSFSLFAGGISESEGAASTNGSIAQTQSEIGPEPRQYNLDDYAAMTGSAITQFGEAPILAKRVESGELPPVEERLPVNPVVMDVWDDVGRYGGVVRYTETNESYCLYLRHFVDSELLELAPSNAFHRYNFVGGEIVPGVLEYWSMSEDGRSVLLRIRKGLKWSDGVPVTTQDVKYAIEDVIKNPEIFPVIEKWANWGGKPVDLKIIDDYSFQLDFAAPNGLFLYELSHWRWWRLLRPRHYLERFHKSYASSSDLAELMEKENYQPEEWGKFYSFV